MNPRLKQQGCSPNPFHLLTPSQQVRRDLPAQERRFVGENQLERSLLFTQVTSWEVTFWEHMSELLPFPLATPNRGLL